MRAPTRLASVLAAWILACPDQVQAAGGSAPGLGNGGARPVLAPTAHPPLPSDPGAFWFAPPAGTKVPPAVDRVASGVALFRAGKYEAALPVLVDARSLEKPAEDYRTYYLAQTYLQLGRTGPARRLFVSLQARQPAGYLVEGALLGEAEAAAAAGDDAQAQQLYERLLASAPMHADLVWFQLGEAARRAGDRPRAIAAFRHLRDAYPLSRQAPAALSRLSALQAIEPLAAGTEQYRLARARADQLFEARRFDEARAAFGRLRPHAQGPERDLIEVRLAACEYSSRRYAAARAALRPYTGQGAHQAEARFYDLMAARALGAPDEFERLATALLQRHGTSPWAAETLNTLAAHYIRRGQDAEADAVFRRLLATFPDGRFAERAAWKVGWRALRSGNAPEAALVFERAAATFPRSDHRPAYLYWAARAHETLGDQQTAAARYALVRTDYLHSYYGGLAHAVLERRGGPHAAPPPPQPAARGQAPAAAGFVPTAPLIRLLLSAGLHDDALTEIRFAQHQWGDSPALQATTGLALHLKGELLAGARAVKRAWPQFLSPTGADLPAEVATVIYPVGFWSRIREHAAQHQLDPYLLAALIAQESGFVPDIRSSAKATGLMQLMPATAQQYARKLGVAGYAPALLERPEINLRLGTAYFAALIREFGDVHLALASYNAGGSRVRRWVAERPGLARDVFVDDIPFPETQEYVKKILGGAENYRRIYGAAAPRPSLANPDRAIPTVAAKRTGAPAPAAPPASRSAASRPAPAKGPAATADGSSAAAARQPATEAVRSSAPPKTLRAASRSAKAARTAPAKPPAAAASKQPTARAPAPKRPAPAQIAAGPTPGAATREGTETPSAPPPPAR